MCGMTEVKKNLHPIGSRFFAIGNVYIHFEEAMSGSTAITKESSCYIRKKLP
jgi:hypothetical protein